MSSMWISPAMAGEAARAAANRVKGRTRILPQPRRGPTHFYGPLTAPRRKKKPRTEVRGLFSIMAAYVKRRSIVALAAGQHEQRLEHVDEVEIEAQRAEDRGLFLGVLAIAGV